MNTIDEIISDIKNSRQQPEHIKKMELYEKRALSELEDKDYYTVTPLANEKMFYPFDINLHENFPSHKAPFHNHDFFELV